MKTVTTPCWSCANLCGCTLLADSKGRFLESRVITEEDNRICDTWEEISEAEMAGRSEAYRIAGMGSLREIHRAPRSKLGKEGKMDGVPDFRAMVRDGMTSAERAEQLRYETNEDGVLLSDNEGRMTPRSAFTLRKYAADPDGPLKKSNRMVMFWPPDQLIDAIVKAEIEAGWVIKSPGAKKTSTPKKAIEGKDKEDEMVEAKRIQLRKPVGGSAPAKAPAGKAASKPAGKTAAPATNGTKITSPATNKKKAAAPSNGSENGSAVPAKATTAAAPDMTKALAPFMKKVDALDKKLDQVLEAIAEASQRNIVGQTILHDILGQRINNTHIELTKLAQGEESTVPESIDAGNLLAEDKDIEFYVEAGDGKEEADEEEADSEAEEEADEGNE